MKKFLVAAALVATVSMQASAATYSDSDTVTANIAESVVVTVAPGSFAPATTAGVVDAQTAAVTGAAVTVQGNNSAAADVTVQLLGNTTNTDGKLENTAGDAIDVSSVTLTGFDAAAYNVSNTGGDTHTGAQAANATQTTTSVDVALPAGTASLPAGAYAGALTVTVNTI